MITFVCPSCNKTWQVKEEYAGRVSRCECKTRLRVPSHPTENVVVKAEIVALPESSPEDTPASSEPAFGRHKNTSPGSSPKVVEKTNRQNAIQDSREPPKQQPSTASGTPASSVRHTGKIVRYNQDGGFGFIQPDDGGEQVFVHVSELPFGEYRHFVVDEPLDFELVPGPKGLKATSLRPPEGRKRGTVAKFVDKGFGFITPEGAPKGKEVFFHFSNWTFAIRRINTNLRWRSASKHYRLCC